jgi:hypothetical protein
MKLNKFSQNQNHQTQKRASDPRPTITADLSQSFPPSANEVAPKASLTAGGSIPKDFAPSPDEVARRAYFSYVNEGSLPGHDVQHWLEAEAQLLAERNLTRVHGFHNRT